MKIAHCKRCGLPLKVEPKAGSKARILRRAKDRHGYCLECAVHDWLRNTYPVNMELAQSGPGILLHSHVVELFAQIMRAGNADAFPDEINWKRIVEQWDLAFPEPVKPSAKNPLSQKDLDEVASGKRSGLGGFAQGR